MLWRVTLFVGVVVAVLLMAGGLWARSITHTVTGGCLVRQNTGSLWAQTYGCAVRDTHTVTPHAEAARDLRYAAGAVVIVTLASLPMLGAGRRTRRPLEHQSGSS